MKKTKKEVIELVVDTEELEKKLKQIKKLLDEINNTEIHIEVK